MFCHFLRFDIFIFILLGCNVFSSVFKYKEYKDCVDIKAKDKRFRKVVNEMFAFHYGDQSIEVFNVLSQSDLKTIEYLRQCVETLDIELFWNRNSQSDRLMQLGGSNVTYLTEIVQTLYPDLQQKIYNAVQLGLKEAEWSQLSVSDLGIRSIEYLTCLGKEAHPSRKQIIKEIERKRESLRGWISFGGGGEVKKQEFDPDADENVISYMDMTPDTLLDVYLFMSDVDTYAGGEMLIMKKNNSVNNAESIDNSGTEYDDEEEDEEEIIVESTTAVSRASPEGVGDTPPPLPRYSSLTSRIDRYSAERGGLIIVPGNVLHGMKPVTKGVLHVLRIQLWAYADATSAGASVASIADARPLLKITREEL